MISLGGTVVNTSIKIAGDDFDEAYLKKKDYRTYFKIRYGILGQTMNLPGKPGRKISSMGYSVMRRIIGFN